MLAEKRIQKLGLKAKQKPVSKEDGSPLGLRDF